MCSKVCSQVLHKELQGIAQSVARCCKRCCKLLRGITYKVLQGVPRCSKLFLRHSKIFKGVKGSFRSQRPFGLVHTVRDSADWLNRDH